MNRIVGGYFPLEFRLEMILLGILINPAVGPLCFDTGDLIDSMVINGNGEVLDL